MRTYVVELSFPGAGDLRPDELQAIGRRSERLVRELGSGLAWRDTYVTADRLYVVYEAVDESLVRRHLDRLGLVPSNVAEVAATIAPTPDTTTS